RVVLYYQGLDRIERRTVIRWDRAPFRHDNGAVVFSITLQPQESTELEIGVACEVGAAAPEVRYADIVDRARQPVAARERSDCQVISSNESLNRWVSRSAADL